MFEILLNIVKHRAHVCLEHVLTEHDGLVWDLVISTLSVESKRSKTAWMAKSIFGCESSPISRNVRCQLVSQLVS